MITLKNPLGLESRILRAGDPLPELPDNVGVLYLDVETTSMDPEEIGVYPYLGHRIAGIAVTWDDAPFAYYFTMRHRLAQNYEPKDVLAWVQALLQRSKLWVNHNIKFDAHFLNVEGLTIPCPMLCTLTAAKLHDSDRYNHELKPICREWCNLPMEEEIRLQAYLKGAKTKDYGDVPYDIVGEYACMDVLGNRVLYKFLLEKLPDQSKLVYQTEHELTSVLYDIEREGMRVDELELKVNLRNSMVKLIGLSEQLYENTGREFKDSATHLFDVFVNQFGLPVLAWNADSGAPSFDYDALTQYSVHPSVRAEPKLVSFVENVLSYREESHFKSLFLESFLRLKDEKHMLHPSYNQVVRTGRMSCKHPNAQQMSPRAKALFHPLPGEAFLSYDASQVEFRLIVHYINDLAAVNAYAENPDIDFHAWVAALCGIKRKQAKNVNFAIAYGAGKRRILKMLASNPEIVAEVGEQVNKMIAEGKLPEHHRASEYTRLCQARAEHIYADYHERLPGIKRLSLSAAERCRYRGYVFNAFGRRRHLPERAAHRAFNTVIQGCAMDYIKDRMIAVSTRNDTFLRERNVRIIANVHDELLFTGPVDVMRNAETRAHILEVLETSPKPFGKEFRVPFRWGIGYSEKTWAEASSDDAVEGGFGKLDPKDYRKAA